MLSAISYGCVQESNETPLVEGSQSGRIQTASICVTGISEYGWLQNFLLFDVFLAVPPAPTLGFSLEGSRREMPGLAPATHQQAWIPAFAGMTEHRKLALALRCPSARRQRFYRARRPRCLYLPP